MGLGTWYMVDEFIKWMTWGHAQCDTKSENTLKLFRAVYKLVSWCSCLPGSNPVSFGSGDHFLPLGWWLHSYWVFSNLTPCIEDLSCPISYG